MSATGSVRPSLRGLLGGVLLMAAACGDDASGPSDGERFAFSFEQGLEGWVPDSADFCELDPETGGCPPDGAYATSDVEVVEGTASEGERSVRLSAENFTDAVKVWIERRFEVEPGAAVRVTVEWDLGTTAFGPGAWTAIGAVGARNPTAAFSADGPEGIGDFRRLGAAESPDGELAFLELELTETVHASASGDVWVGIGIWGTFEVNGTYFVDAVTVDIDPAG